MTLGAPARPPSYHSHPHLLRKHPGDYVLSQEFPVGLLSSMQLFLSGRSGKFRDRSIEFRDGRQ